MNVTVISNDKELGHYYYLYWVIGRMKEIKHIEDDEKMLQRLKAYEDEFKELKERLRERESA